MTWIKTVPMAEADEVLTQALERQRSLYPREYATPVFPTGDGTSGIVASHSLIPDALYHAFGTFGVLQVTLIASWFNYINGWLMRSASDETAGRSLTAGQRSRTASSAPPAPSGAPARES